VETPTEECDNDGDLEEMAYLTKRFQYLTNKRRFSGRSSGFKGSSLTTKKGYQKGGCFKCNKIGHFIADCPELHK